MKTNGAILYRGPSMLDGSPIVAIVTGLRTGSSNAKTGNMLQTWILRNDVAPNVAIKTGADAAICGGCPLRGNATGDSVKGRGCYVTVHQAPLSVWKAYKRGVYPDLSNQPALIAQAGEGRAVRLGSYGDPVAVPVSVWRSLTKWADRWTGYTHQWRSAAAVGAEWKRLVMASVESHAGALEASMVGWRTFRVIASEDDLASDAEVLCPASEEAGHKSSCERCGLCMGTTSRSRKSVAIVAHGSGRKHAKSVAVSLA